MVQINLKSLNKESLHLYKTFLIKILEKISIDYKTFDLPTKRKRITLLKSPHVNKSAREQFELKAYKSVIYISNKISSEKIKFIIINKPKTIKVNIKNII
jgi:small subunit ribosomal protein S10